MTKKAQHKQWSPEKLQATGATPQKGTVKWFSRLKGYGFIEPSEGGPEVFVHYSAIVGEGYRNLFEGDVVTFWLINQGKGPQAQWVEVQRVQTAAGTTRIQVDPETEVIVTRRQPRKGKV